jgi:single-strand DNA-binding protein
MGQKNGFQRIVALGNLGKDVDFRYTQNGKMMISFSLGVTTGFGDNSHTEWFNVAKVGEGLDKIAEYLKKGKCVLVEGKLKTTRRDGEDGKPKYWTTLWADSITLMADGNGNGNGNTKSGKSDDDVPTGGGEDEIPF